MYSPVFKHPEQKQRTKIIPIAVVAILLISGIGYFAYTRFLKPQELPLNQQETQNSPPASEEGNQSDWETYRNEEFGFHLRYPEVKYSIVENRYGALRLDAVDHSLDTPYVLIEVGPTYAILAYNLNATSIHDYAQDYKSDYYNVVIHENEKYTINGFHALRQIYSVGEYIDGKLLFNNLGSVKAAARYVFWNGSDKYIILSTGIPGIDTIKKYDKEGSIEQRRNRNMLFLDQIEQTFSFISK